MVKVNHFFDNHPAILTRCLDINKEINHALNKKRIAENEVSFDLILPFLFKDIETNEVKMISKELRLHREIADYYNSGIDDINEFLNVLNKFGSAKPVTYIQYQDINKRSRNFLNDDLIASYLLSTERVYYRFQIIDKLNIDTERKITIIQKVKEFSAFLLFDDDVYDLESDIAKGKETILTQYLSSGNSLSEGIEVMINLIKDGSELFEQFTKHYKNIYANG